MTPPTKQHIQVYLVFTLQRITVILQIDGVFIVMEKQETIHHMVVLKQHQTIE